jgi:hypothetical protein
MGLKKVKIALHVAPTKPKGYHDLWIAEVTNKIIRAQFSKLKGSHH